MKTEEETLNAFFKNRCSVRTKSRIKSVDLYERYLEFCEALNAPAVSSKALGLALKKHFSRTIVRHATLRFGPDGQAKGYDNLEVLEDFAPPDSVLPARHGGVIVRGRRYAPTSSLIPGHCDQAYAGVYSELKRLHDAADSGADRNTYCELSILLRLAASCPMPDRQDVLRKFETKSWNLPPTGAHIAQLVAALRAD